MERSDEKAVAAVPAADTEELSVIQDPKVQAALLRHPAVSQDQQVVLPLLQASKYLQAAVCERCAGQVPAALHAWQLKDVLCLAQLWLPKHGGLLRELEVQFGDSKSGEPGFLENKWSAAAVEALAAALEQQQHLQAFCLRGAPPGQILQHLPAACLTRLCVSVDFRTNSNSIAGLTRLTSLRSLDLLDSIAVSVRGRSALEPIAGLQRLTELCIGTVTPRQLQQLQLPPLLQHLDVTVDMERKVRYLKQLAAWLQQHGSKVRRLELTDVCNVHDWDTFCNGGADNINQQWVAAYNCLASALQVAGSALPVGVPTGSAEAAAAALASSPSAPAAIGPGLQLQSFVLEEYMQIGPILQCLPASTLSHLQCILDYSSVQQWDTLCGLTALRSLSLDANDMETTEQSLHEQPPNVLAALSALKQLTLLHLQQPRLAQLQHLPPWLKALEVSEWSRGKKKLQLSHLTALTALRCPDNFSGDVLRARDVLPPNLRVLEWPCCRSVQPLLALSCLESLSVTEAADGVPSTELQQLSNLPRLADVQLAYRRSSELLADTAAAAWRALPLKSLDLQNNDIDDDDEKPVLSAMVVSAALMQELSALHGLTQLSLGSSSRMRDGNDNWLWSLEATPAHLAAALPNLTALRSLEVCCFEHRRSGCVGVDASAGWLGGWLAWLVGKPCSAGGCTPTVVCVEAVCRLPALSRLHLTLPVLLDSNTYRQLTSITVTQLLPLDKFELDIPYKCGELLMEIF